MALWDQTQTAMFAGPTVDRAKSKAVRVGDRMVRDLIHSPPRPLTAPLSVNLS